MINWQRFVWYQLPPIVLVIIIFIESSIADINVPHIAGSLSDKLAHIFAFFLLGFFITRAFKFSKNIRFVKNAITFGIVFGTLYGIIDEVHQYFVPGRYSEVGDFIADFIGVILAQFIFYVYYEFIDRQRINRKLPENY